MSNIRTLYLGLDITCSKFVLVELIYHFHLKDSPDIPIQKIKLNEYQCILGLEQVKDSFCIAKKYPTKNMNSIMRFS